jgi:hypothetical protein
MAILANIQIALDSRLNTLTGLPDVAWSNTNYKPSKGTTWLRPTLLPAASTSATFAGKDRHQGIYQVDIFVSKDNGLKPMYDLADAIRSHFHKQTLTESDDKVYIDVVSLANYDRVESWFMGSVEINYFSIEE